MRKTHPRDGSLSASNPTRALDTLNFRLTMKEGAGKAKHEMTAEEVWNEYHTYTRGMKRHLGKELSKYTGTRD